MLLPPDQLAEGLPSALSLALEDVSFLGFHENEAVLADGVDAGGEHLPDRHRRKDWHARPPGAPRFRDVVVDAVGKRAVRRQAIDATVEGLAARGADLLLKAAVRAEAERDLDGRSAG